MAKKKENLSFEEKLQNALVSDWDQPYAIPENWVWTKIEYLQHAVNGFFDGDWILSENIDDSGQVRLLQLSDIGIGKFLDKSNKYITTKTFSDLQCKKLLAGDVMISRMAEPIARSCIVPNLPYVSITAVDVAVMRSNSKLINNAYLNYVCNTTWFTDMAFSLARGTTRVRITRKNLGQMPFPLPPLVEQERIVARIESMFEKLDRAKELAQNAIDSFEERKSAILHQAFTGELTKKWRNENDVRLDSWIKSSLNDVAQYKKGPFGSSITKAMFVPKGINTFKVYEQGNAIRKTTNYGDYYISKEKFVELKGFAIQPGDIIVSCAGTIGEIYKLPDNCENGVINQALMRVRMNEGVNDKFFIYYFGGILKGDINDKAKGTAIKNIPPFAIMKKISLPLPSHLEQIEIVRILDRFFEKEKKAKELSDVIAKIDLMKKSILARAFRGKLGTNDPSEDSSIELLKEVLASG